MRWLYCVLLVLCWFALEAKGDTNPMQVEKTERFKKLIDFDATIRLEKATQAVNIVWPEMLKAPGIDSGQWVVAADSVWRVDRGVVREWVLRRDIEQIAIVIFASSDGFGPSQNFLLSRATENMMFDSPFIKGPAGLGSLAVSMPSGAPHNLIWVFRNLCFDVRSDNSQVDIGAIALWLQSIAETGIMASVPLEPRLIDSLSVSSHQVEVGVPVDIRVQVTTPEDEDRYFIDLEFDSHAIEVMSQERLAAKIRGRAIGHTTLDFYLIDKTTLQLEHSNIKLEFFPK